MQPFKRKPLFKQILFQYNRCFTSSFYGRKRCFIAISKNYRTVLIGTELVVNYRNKKEKMYSNLFSGEYITNRERRRRLSYFNPFKNLADPINNRVVHMYSDLYGIAVKHGP
jgi:hypothetical protein